MARKLTADVTQVMELEEYDSFVHENVDFGDFDCLCETAWALKALANNSGFLAKAANQQLRDRLDGKKSSHFTANSIVFVQDEYHTIRANIWAPLSKDPRKSKLEAPLYSILQLP